MTDFHADASTLSYYVETQAVVETAGKLKERTRLSGVYVVPSELLDKRMWAGKPNELKEDFSHSLGRLAAPILRRELVNLALLHHAVVAQHDDAPSMIRVGVAAGTTIEASFLLPFLGGVAMGGAEIRLS